MQNKELSNSSGLELYDFNARTYDQQIGRFVQVDPWIEEGGQEVLSPYHFAANNPIRYSDLTGKCPICPAIPYIASAIADALVAGGAATGITMVVVKAVENAPNIDVTAGSGGANLTTAHVLPTPRSALGGETTSIPQSGEVVGTAVYPKPPSDAPTLKRETTVNAQGSGEGRGSNKRKPDPQAGGDHSVVNENGSTTYKRNERNPTGYDEVERIDTKGRPHQIEMVLRFQRLISMLKGKRT